PLRLRARTAEHPGRHRLAGPPAGTRRRMSEPLVVQLARFAAAEPDPALREAIERNVSERVLDTIGVALAARDAAASADPVAYVVEAWGGAPQASLFGRSLRLPAAAAALHNGTLA